MQDNYVGDIGDYGKYGLLRNVTAAGLRLAVNWYRVVQASRKMENLRTICTNQIHIGSMIRSCSTVCRIL